MKTIKAKCQYCDKELISLYPKQLKWNLESHESSCKDNPKNIILKKKVIEAVKRIRRLKMRPTKKKGSKAVAKPLPIEVNLKEFTAIVKATPDTKGNKT